MGGNKGTHEGVRNEGTRTGVENKGTHTGVENKGTHTGVPLRNSGDIYHLSVGVTPCGYP